MRAKRNPVRGGTIGFLLLLLLTGWPLSAGGEVVATPEIVPRFEPAPCPFTLPPPERAGETYECGFVFVPLDHDDPSAGSIRLAVAWLHATGSDPAPDPILWLEGGPGASALVVADTNRKIVAEARRQRDVILFDQRGAGYSGYLDCGAYLAAAAQRTAAAGTPFPDPPGEDAGVAAIYGYAAATAALGYAECRDGYREAGVDLRHFTTEAIARDALAILDAFGYEQATLWGTSYGGRVASAIMRAAPERVRATVLDSPLPLGMRRLATFVTLETEPIRNLFAWCEADAECSRVYPDLESRAIALIAQLDATPLPVRGEAAAPAGLRRGFDGDALKRLLTAVLPNNPAVAGAIPRAIADLEAGDPDVAVALLAGIYPPPPEREIPASLTETTFETLNAPTDARLALSLTMRTVVLCNDEAADVRLAAVVDEARIAENDPLGGETPFRSAITLLAQCHALRTGAAPLDPSPPAVPVPTLVLAGAYDATTAPSWAASAAAELPGAELVAVPGAGHATGRWSVCARAIIAAFIATPDAPVDRGCLVDEAPELLLPDEPTG